MNAFASDVSFTSNRLSMPRGGITKFCYKHHIHDKEAKRLCSRIDRDKHAKRRIRERGSPKS
jgi:hypothetical protein